MPIWMARLTEQAAHKKLSQYWLDPKITGGTASEVFTCPYNVAEEAVEQAYKDQLDRVLTSLKIPQNIKEFIRQQHGLSEESQLGKLISEISSLKSKLSESETNIKTTNQTFEIQVARLKNELINYKKINEMLMERLNNIDVTYPEGLYHEIRDLELFSDSDIKPSQFEKLRSNYRKSVEIIRILALRETKRKKTN